MKKRGHDSQKGITLVALVITIIVLLILAGVTINMLLGDNGIIRQAQQAKKVHNEKSDEEIIEMALGGQKIKILTEGGRIDEKALQEELERTYGKGKVSVYGEEVIIGENEYKINLDGTASKKENMPLIADEAETSNWSYTYTDMENGGNKGLTIVGYKGTLLPEKVLTIPSVLTVNGKQEQVIRIAGGSESMGYTGASSFNSKDAEKVIISYGITELYTNAFSNDQDDNNSLKEVSIPSSIKNIGYWAFSGCELLNNVVIPYGITEINGLFRGCSSLTNLKIPPTVTKLSSMAFNSTPIKTIDFTNITELGEAALIYSKFEELDLTKVTSIGNSAFLGCTELRKIILPNITISRDSNIFGNTEWEQPELTNLTYIEYKGVVYTSVNEFYNSL